MITRRHDINADPIVAQEAHGDFVRRLKALMVAAGFIERNGEPSQTKLAAAAGVSRAAVGHWFTERWPGSDLAEPLAKALNTNAHYLFVGKGNDGPLVEPLAVTEAVTRATEDAYGAATRVFLEAWEAAARQLQGMAPMTVPATTEEIATIARRLGYHIDPAAREA